jgi:hypothetical protein
MENCTEVLVVPLVGAGSSMRICAGRTVNAELRLTLACTLAATARLNTSFAASSQVSGALVVRTIVACAAAYWVSSGGGDGGGGA